MQQEPQILSTKKEEGTDQDTVLFINPYETEMQHYREQVEKTCQRYGMVFSRFISKKRCNQTKIVCKLLRHLLSLSKIEDFGTDSEFYQSVSKSFSQMTQINDIRRLLMDERMYWFRTTLKTYILSPYLLLPIVSLLSKQDYVKFLLLESLDVLHMMVDDPYRNYSTWMAVRQMAKGDYTALIAMIDADEEVSLPYIKQYVSEVYQLRSVDMTFNRKCSDTNNTFYFITSFLLRFLKDSQKELTNRSIKKEQAYDNISGKLDAISKGIEMLHLGKSHYTLTQIALNNTLRNFIRKEYFETKNFLLRILTYQKITSLTVKNIIDKYDELIKMFR